jgi:hypothetical protein
MPLFDAQCPGCGWRGEVLDVEPCPECSGPTVADALCYRPTQVQDIRMSTVFAKGAQIRKRLQGKLPWRKYSYSQSD